MRSRFSRRRVAMLAAALGIGAATRTPTLRAQPLDIPGNYQNVPLLPGVAGPYSALAGVDPAGPVPAEWQPRGGAVAALPALPGHLQHYVDEIIVRYTAPYGFTNHAYGWPNRKAGTVNHLPVCDTLQQLRSFFLSGQNQGLTHLGIDRPTWKLLDLTAADGSVWRAPFAEVNQFCDLVGEVAPWAQGKINTVGTCAVPPHPIASRMRSGEPNGAYISIENVARIGSQGMEDGQFNSNVFARAMVATYFRHPINHDTQVWHAGIDRVDRCFDTGWPGGYFGGLEVAAQAAANAVLRGDFSLLRGAVRLSAPPPAINWQDEAWRALVNKRIRIQQDAYAVDVRDTADARTNDALQGIDPALWQGVTLAAWREQIERDETDIAKSTVRRDAARAQLSRLGG